jgi:hypothetical protein
MATGVVKKNSVIAVEVESTEGTYAVPSAATSYIQPLSGGFGMSPNRELLDRDIITASVGRATPKLGMKGISGTLGVEFRASGTEGGDVDFGPMIKSALGTTRAISTNTTTKSSGNSGTVLAIEDADISKFTVGDIIVVKQTNAYHISPITSIVTTLGSATITLLVPKPTGVFSNSVVVSKVTMYLTATTGHPALSVSYYWGNEIRQAAIGSKVKTLALENFQTGKLANLNFQFEGLTYTEIDGAAPHTPSYDSGTPPVILGACVYKDGVEMQLNSVSLNVENTLSPITDTCSSNGKTSQRVTKRTLTGSINPYMDDTTVAFNTLFDAGTEFSLFLKAYIPSSTSGEYTLGSVIGIYLPKCIVTEYKKGDLEGILIDEVSFAAVRGAAGTTEEMYLGFI